MAVQRGKEGKYICCCSVTKLCPTLCNSMDCSTPGLLVPHHLSEFAQVHVHCIGDAIQPSHPLVPPRVKTGDGRYLVQSLSRLRLFATPWTAARQASLSITSSWSLFIIMSIEPVIPSNHLILCHPLLLLPSILPRIRVFYNESVLCIRWSKHWSFSFSISPSVEY